MLRCLYVFAKAVVLDEPAGEFESALIKVELKVLSVIVEAVAEVHEPCDLIFCELSNIQLYWLACDVRSGFPGLHDGSPFQWALREVASVYSYIRSREHGSGRDIHSVDVMCLTFSASSASIVAALTTPCLAPRYDTILLPWRGTGKGFVTRKGYATF